MSKTEAQIAYERYADKLNAEKPWDKLNEEKPWDELGDHTKLAWIHAVDSLVVRLDSAIAFHLGKDKRGREYTVKKWKGGWYVERSRYVYERLRSDNCEWDSNAGTFDHNFDVFKFSTREGAIGALEQAGQGELS